MQLTTCGTQMLRLAWLACLFRLSFILPPSSFATSGCGMSNVDGRTLSGCLRFCGNPQLCWGMVPARHAFWAASLWDPAHSVVCLQVMFPHATGPTDPTEAPILVIRYPFHHEPAAPV